MQSNIEKRLYKILHKLCKQFFVNVRIMIIVGQQKLKQENSIKLVIKKIEEDIKY